VDIVQFAFCRPGTEALTKRHRETPRHTTRQTEWNDLEWPRCVHWWRLSFRSLCTIVKCVLWETNKRFENCDKNGKNRHLVDPRRYVSGKPRSTPGSCNFLQQRATRQPTSTWMIAQTCHGLSLIFFCSESCDSHGWFMAGGEGRSIYSPFFPQVFHMFPYFSKVSLHVFTIFPWFLHCSFVFLYYLYWYLEILET
jgi:hypothetical protein